MLEIDFPVPRQTEKFQIDLTQSAPFFQFDLTQMTYAQMAASYLNTFSKEGLLDLSGPKRIIDIGAGTGISTLSLAQMAYRNRGTITAIEKDKEKAQSITGLGILPPERVVAEDAVTALYDLASRGERYDLGAAFRLGPDFEGELIERLLPAAEYACAPGGSFMVMSDWLTMNCVKQAFKQRNILFTPVTTHKDRRDPEHSALITSFQRH